MLTGSHLKPEALPILTEPPYIRSGARHVQAYVRNIDHHTDAVRMFNKRPENKSRASRSGHGPGNREDDWRPLSLPAGPRKEELVLMHRGQEYC